MKFGERLAKLRKERGLAQRELAKRLSVSIAIVAQWEESVACPDKDTFEAIAKALSVPVGKLIGSEELMELSEIKRNVSLQKFLTFSAGTVDIIGIALPFLPLWGSVTVSGGYTQLMSLTGVGKWICLSVIILAALNGIREVMFLHGKDTPAIPQPFTAGLIISFVCALVLTVFGGIIPGGVIIVFLMMKMSMFSAIRVLMRK